MQLPTRTKNQSFLPGARIYNDRVRNILLDITREVYGISRDNPYLSDYKQFICLDEETEQTEWYRRAMEQAAVFWQAVPWEDGYRDSK